MIEKQKMFRDEIPHNINRHKHGDGRIHRIYLIAKNKVCTQLLETPYHDTTCRPAEYEVDK